MSEIHEWKARVFLLLYLQFTGFLLEQPYQTPRKHRPKYTYPKLVDHVHIEAQRIFGGGHATIQVYLREVKVGHVDMGGPFQTGDWARPMFS
jgi:hypothetical protein